MRRPTWATVVGVLGIVFGCMGILSAGQEMYMPKMMDMQKEIVKDIRQTATQTRQQEATSGGRMGWAPPIPDFPKKASDLFETMFDYPEWFGRWSIASGTAKACVSALYLLAAIGLLRIKPMAVRLFCVAAAGSITLCIVKCLVAIMALAFMGMAMTIGSVFSVFIDGALIVVVVTGDKTAFFPIRTAAPQPVGIPKV